VTNGSELVLKGRGKHVWEELEEDGKEELESRDDDEDRKGKKSKEIDGGSLELLFVRTEGKVER